MSQVAAVPRQINHPISIAGGLDVAGDLDLGGYSLRKVGEMLLRTDETSRIYSSSAHNIGIGAGDRVVMAGTLNDPSSDGQLVHKSFLDKRLKCAFKGVDQIVNNSAVLRNDNQLSFLVIAGKRYWFRIVCHFSARQNSGVKISINGPAVTYILAYGQFNYVITHVSFPTSYVIAALDNPATLATIDAPTTILATIEGYLHASAGGLMYFRWAQGTAVAEDTICREGSFLLAGFIL